MEFLTGAAVARDSAKYVTGAVHSGDLASAVTAFQGDVKFTLTVKKAGGDQTISIDLADMGSTPRTMQRSTESLPSRFCVPTSLRFRHCSRSAWCVSRACLHACPMLP